MYGANKMIACLQGHASHLTALKSFVGIVTYYMAATNCQQDAAYFVVHGASKTAMLEVLNHLVHLFVRIYKALNSFMIICRYGVTLYSCYRLSMNQLHPDITLSNRYDHSALF